MKQETLEKAAERFYREYPNNPLDKPEWHFNKDINCFRKRKAFIAGAKWQEERMYSEEEVLNLIFKFTSDFDLKKGIEISIEEQKEWFKQLKTNKND